MDDYRAAIFSTFSILKRMSAKLRRLSGETPWEQTKEWIGAILGTLVGLISIGGLFYIFILSWFL